MSNNLLKVVFCAYIVPGDSSDSFTPGSYTARASIDAALIVNFAESISEVRLTTISVELVTLSV